MGALAQHLADLFSPWVDFYSDSYAAELIITFLHLGGMLAGGGLAFSLDRAVLRSARRPTRELARELGGAHLAVLVGMALMFVSGIAMTAADPKTYLVSLVFWLKMAAVLLLLVNGWILKRAGERLAEDPDEAGAFRRLRHAAVRSMGLWVLTLLAGVALTVYG